jgi:hypothetical protein
VLDAPYLCQVNSGTDDHAMKLNHFAGFALVAT